MNVWPLERYDMHMAYANIQEINRDRLLYKKR